MRARSEDDGPDARQRGAQSMLIHDEAQRAIAATRTLLDSIAPETSTRGNASE
jgi:hypothetical protein